MMSVPPVAKKYQSKVHKSSEIAADIMSLSDKSRKELEDGLRLLMEETRHDNEKNSVVAYYLGLSKLRKKLSRRIRKKQRFDHRNVSDHAVIRYLDRVLGIDTKLIRRRIVKDALKNALEVRFSHNMIVTVIRERK